MRDVFLGRCPRLWLGRPVGSGSNCTAARDSGGYLAGRHGADGAAPSRKALKCDGSFDRLRTGAARRYILWLQQIPVDDFPIGLEVEFADGLQDVGA